MIAAIVGAGPLATALASTLAARGRVRHVRLIDDAGTVASGKALDVRQSTPVLGTDVSIDATADLAAVADADVILIADAHGAPAAEWEGELGLSLLGRIAAANSRAPIVCAGARQASLVERGVTELRLPWTRILGSASIAFDAAARTVVAEAAETAARTVSLALAGLPPSRLVVGWSASSIEGAPGRGPARAGSPGGRDPPADRGLAARPVRARRRRRRAARAPRRGQPGAAAGDRRDAGAGSSRRDRAGPSRAVRRPARRGAGALALRAHRVRQRDRVPALAGACLKTC